MTHETVGKIKKLFFGAPNIVVHVHSGPLIIVAICAIGWGFRSSQSRTTTITGPLKIVGEDGKIIAEIGTIQKSGTTPAQNAITLYSSDGKPAMKLATEIIDPNSKTLEIYGANSKKQVELSTGPTGGYVLTNSNTGKPRINLGPYGLSVFGSDNKPHIHLGELNKRYGFQIADNRLHSSTELYCMPDGPTFWLHDPKGSVTLSAGKNPELELSKPGNKSRILDLDHGLRRIK